MYNLEIGLYLSGSTREARERVPKQTETLVDCLNRLQDLKFLEIHVNYDDRVEPKVYTQLVEVLGLINTHAYTEGRMVDFDQNSKQEPRHCHLDIQESHDILNMINGCVSRQILSGYSCRL